MYHSLFFQLQNWTRSKKKMLQSRMALVVFLTINFVNSTLLILEVLGPQSILACLLFSMNLIISGITIYGIYYFKPTFLSPNVICKVGFASASLFYCLQLSETNSYASTLHLVWLIMIAVLFIAEIHSTFSASFEFIRHFQIKELSKPPPSYTQVVENEGSPPSYTDALEKLSKPGYSGHAIVEMDVASLPQVHLPTQKRDPIEVVERDFQNLKVSVYTCG